MYLGQDLGHGFFQVDNKDEIMLQKLLVQTPHIS